MRLYILVSMLLGAIFIQGTLLDFFIIRGIKPDLLMIIIVFNAFLNGPKEGALLGLLGGLFEDLAVGSYLGMHGLTMMFGGYMVGLLKNNLYKNSHIIIFFLVGLTTFITQLLNYTLLAISEVNINFMVAILEIIIPTAIYTALIAPIFYGKFYRSSTTGALSSEKL